MKTKLLRVCLFVIGTLLLAAALTPTAYASIQPMEPQLEDSPLLDAAASSEVGGGPGSQDPNISININGESSDGVRIVVLMTILTVLPSLLLMMTCFTRIVIVFSLLRNAMGLQQTPPNQVIIGLALFLTLFIMHPVLSQINTEAYEPYSEGVIETDEFLDRAQGPLKEFMLKQTKTEDLNLFLTLADQEQPDRIEDYTMEVVVPAFMTSEVKRAFTIGFLLFLPFLMIDIIVSSSLMSMGMMMLPPVTVSMPFKLMLFVLVDGWGLLIKTLVQSYNM